MSYNSDLIEALFRQAVELYSKGDFSTSFKLFHKIILFNPEDYTAMKYLALLYKASGDYQNAINYLKKIIPVDAEIYYLLGICYLYREQVNLAIDNFKNSIEVNPKYFISYANLGSCWQMTGDFALAIENYNLYLQYDTKNPEIYNNLGLIYESLNNNEKSELYFRKALDLNSSDSKFFINLARILQKQMKLVEAKAMFLNAINLNPLDHDIYNNLAVNYQYEKEYALAIDNYKKAISLNNNNPDFYNNLATVLELVDNLSEALENYLIAIKLEPENKNFYYNLGSIYEKIGLYNNSIKEYRKAIELDNSFADAHLNLGIILLLLGKFTEGWQEYEWRLIADKYTFAENKPVWQGENIENKTLLIRNEHGHGDLIQFSRYINMLEKAKIKVILECPDNLIKIFENSFTARFISIKSLSDIEYHYQIYLMSLPLVFKTNKETIPNEVPYLFAKNILNPKCKKIIDNLNIKIGVVWSGNPLHKNNENRSCDISYFYNLAQKFNIKFLSLQKSLFPIDKKFMDRIIDLSEFISDYNDTALIINSLDLVISVDTSVAHLSGALNKKVWILLGNRNDWRWNVKGSKSKWYPSMKIFRKGDEDWDFVFNKVYKELGRLFRL